MESKFELKQIKGKLHVHLIGNIDDEFQFPQLRNHGDLVIDCGKIQSISSTGIRSWITWLQHQSHQKIISLINCPLVIVDQMNMVKNFLPKNGQVDSFYVPFYSEETEECKNVLLVRDREFNKHEVITPEVFDSQGKPMEIDILASRYFSFLNLSA